MPQAIDRIKLPTMEELKKIEETVIPLEQKLQSLKYKLNNVKRTEKQKRERLQNETVSIRDLAQPSKKKQLMKVLSEINDPYYIDALIVQLEARSEQLDPDYQSYTPKR